MFDHALRPGGRTFHHGDFTAARLAADRETSVSVVIPARDEEATVGAVVSALHDQVVEGSALVDELVVIDGGSRDATAVVAADAGAKVLAEGEILPGAGSGTGKGEALWKGLAATTGDVVAFVDADLHDVDARFVTGLVGPLLTDPTVAFVKAAYDRPLVLDEAVHPGEGGRVTELLARPLICTFWPELAWVVQPLAGEYAGRRRVLEQVPFVQGYGVELAMLIDVAARCGTEAMAQVDLGVRRHDHQPLGALGRMAGEILHVALDRLEASGRGGGAADVAAARLHQPFRDDGEAAWRTTPHELEPRQRPPLAQWLADHHRAGPRHELS